MFKENFIKLCNQKNESPSYVCKQVGITPATYSCWNKDSIPRKATLMRIAEYFGVSVEDLLSKKEKNPVQIIEPMFALSNKEKMIIIEYRKKVEMQPAIDKLLEIEDGVVVYTAAHSEDNIEDEYKVISKEVWERIMNAPVTDDPLL